MSKMYGVLWIHTKDNYQALFVPGSGSVSSGKPYFSRLSFRSVVGGACLSALSLVLNPRLWPCRSSGGLNSNTLVTLPAQRTECLDKGHIFYQREISCKWSIKFVVGRGKIHWSLSNVTVPCLKNYTIIKRGSPLPQGLKNKISISTLWKTKKKQNFSLYIVEETLRRCLPAQGSAKIYTGQPPSFLIRPVFKFDNAPYFTALHAFDSWYLSNFAIRYITSVPINTLKHPSAIERCWWLPRSKLYTSFPVNMTFLRSWIFIFALSIPCCIATFFPGWE